MKHFLALFPVVCLILPTILIGCNGQQEEEIMVDITGKKILMVLPAQSFRDEELEIPHDKFTAAGGNVTLASSSLKEARGMIKATAQADKLIKDVSAADYDAVIFVGGTGSREYFDDQTAHNLARSAVKANKIVGAICIAPSILANAGVLEGKKATCYFSEGSNLEKKGATFTGNAVEVDGKIITAEGPKAAGKFADAVMRALAQ